MYDGLIAAQPPNDSVIAALTRQLGQLDGVHDDLIRSMFDRLQSEIRLAVDEDTRNALVAAHDALFPNGESTIQLSYAEEGGEAKMRAGRVDADILKTLHKMKTFDGRNLEALYQHWQEVATEVGRLDKRRDELGAEGAKVARAGDARNAWIRTINALAAVIVAAGIDEEPILGRIRQAEAAADASAPRAAAVRVGTSAEAGTGDAAGAADATTAGGTTDGATPDAGGDPSSA